MLKATAKEPESRYATAQELADDLKRFHDNRPIEARRPTLAERAARWSRRHYWAVSRAIALSLALLLMIALAFFNMQQRVAKQQQRAERNMVMALHTMDQLYRQFADEAGFAPDAAGDHQVRIAQSMTPQTEKFLSTVGHFYEGFTAANRDDPTIHVVTAYTRAGECRILLRKYAAAEEAFKQAIFFAEELLSESPDSVLYQAWLARAQTGLARLGVLKDYRDKPIARLTDAIRVSPNDASLYFQRGKTYSIEGELDKAIEDYTKAIRLDPNEPNIYFNRGLIHAKKGDFDQAIDDFDKVIRINPEHATAYAARGEAHGEKRDFDKAIADYNRAIEIDPNESRCHNGLGGVHVAKGDSPQAINCYNEAIRLSPGSAPPYNNRGLVYLRRREFVEAIADFDQAIRLLPEAWQPYYGRGSVYLILQQGFCSSLIWRIGAYCAVELIGP